MTGGGYNQFCPIAMASEILSTRWTLLLLRELILGSTRFNELRRGLPRLSPALLSKRLKDLEAAGIITRTKGERDPDAHEYHMTEAGLELRPIIEMLGVWGKRWVTSQATLANLDADLLMWDVRRNIDTDPMPRKRTTVQFIFTDLPAARRDYWLIAEPHKPIDLCIVDPGFDVDVYVSTDLRTMTEIWLGYISVSRAAADNRLVLTGSQALRADLTKWLKLSVFAKVAQQVA